MPRALSVASKAFQNLYAWDEVFLGDHVRRTTEDERVEKVA
jgi:hypothetical protein